jgi:hypothetical protein
MLLLAAAIIAPHRDELLNTFWRSSSATQHPDGRSLTAWSTRTALICVTFTFTYWVANFNNRAPTPIDGVWDVLAINPPQAAERLPATYFFEYNRAFMTVLKSRSGVYTTHHFEVDRQSQHLRI